MYITDIREAFFAFFRINQRFQNLFLVDYFQSLILSTGSLLLLLPLCYIPIVMRRREPPSDLLQTNESLPGKNIVDDTTNICVL